MARYRIVTKYPCYNGCIPFTGYFVQRLEIGMFLNKWVDVKGFDTLNDALSYIDKQHINSYIYHPYICSECGQWHIGHRHKRK